MEEYKAVLKKVMYDGGWKAKFFDNLWERIKHKACKVPVKTIKKLSKWEANMVITSVIVKK